MSFGTFLQKARGLFGILICACGLCIERVLLPPPSLPPMACCGRRPRIIWVAALALVAYVRYDRARLWDRLTAEWDAWRAAQVVAGLAFVAPHPSQSAAALAGSFQLSAAAAAALPWYHPGATRLRFVTVANKERPGLARLLRSAARFPDAPPVEVLGMGDGRITGWAAGFGLKLILLLDFVDSVPPDTAVLFADAYDVIVQVGRRPLPT